MDKGISNAKFVLSNLSQKAILKIILEGIIKIENSNAKIVDLSFTDQLSLKIIKKI
jgi:hypothetical protein